MSNIGQEKLGSVADFINGDRGKNYPSKKDFKATGIPFINAGHIDGGTISFEGMNYIDEKHFGRLGSGKTRQNDIVFCLRGSLGKNAVVSFSENAAIASSLVVIRPKELCDTRYLFRYLNSPLTTIQIKQSDNGSSQPNLSAASVKQFEIPLPPLPEQKRIAAILDAADALRAKRRESIEQLDSLIQSTFLEMFGALTPDTGLGKVCQFSQGLQVPVEQQFEEFREGCVQFLRIVDYTQDTEPRFIKTPGERYQVEGDDIAMVRYGATAGYVGIGKTGVIANNLFKFKFDKRLILPIYLFYVLRDERFKRFIEKTAFGAAMPALSFKKINDFLFSIPPLDLQTQFASIVESIEQQKTRLKSHLVELDTLFASLQSRAFNGELVA